MYKNIIFDLGGVVVDFNPKEFLLERFYNETIETIVYDLTFGSEEWALLDAGKLTQEQAYGEMLEKARTAGRVFEVQSVLDDWPRMLKTRRRTVETMKRLKNMGFSLYYLSNISHETLELIRKRDFWQLFDGGIASCEVGINKPDAGIYQALLQTYQLDCSESIFVDDRKDNTTAAFDLGITGIHYKGSASFIRALNTCGIPLTGRLVG